MVATLAFITDKLAVCEQRILSLEQDNKLLKNGKNSSTSSTSPSHDIGRSNQTNTRVKGQNKVGGQIGHEGSTLLMTDKPDKIIPYKAIDFCKVCNGNITEAPYVLQDKRQEIVLPPTAPLYVEHQFYKKVCTCCGAVNKTDIPNNLSGNIQYGSSVETQVAYMHAYQFMSMNRLQAYFKNVFNLELSQGTINSMLTRFVARSQQIYKIIQQKVLVSAVVGADETGSKIAGGKGWFHVWQTPRLTFIAASQTRGHENVVRYFPNGFKNATLVSDCWASQLKTKAAHHQLCLAHLLRELKNFQDALKDDWSIGCEALFKKAIDIKKESKQKGLEYYKADIENIKQAFDTILNVDESTKHAKVKAFIRRLRKNRDSVFKFLIFEDVPYENNASERAIRNVKTKTKVSGCFRTLFGAHRFAIIRSVIDTTIKNTKNIFEALAQIAALPLPAAE